MTTDAAAIWPEVRARLCRSVPERAFRLYLAGLEPVECRDGRLVLAAHPDACRWVEDRFRGVLDQAVVETAGDTLNGVSVVRAGQTGARHPPTPAETRSTDGDDSGGLALGNPRHTFEHFVIGPGNRLAHAAALAVAEQPGQAYNPLVLCGPPGVGKTHLLGAIAHYVDRHGGGLSVRCVSAEAFSAEFRAALASGAMQAFKSRYRSLDLLAINDAEFFQSKARTQEELSHTLAALDALGSQVVLAAERAPTQLFGLDARVRERLSRGLVCELSGPDRATRLGILRQRVAHDDVALHDPGALAVLAEQETTDVRALEGMLVRAVALASLAGRPLDGDLARDVLGGLATRRGTVLDPIAEVQAAAARAYGVTTADLVSRSRATRVLWPRHVAMYLAREVSGQSLMAVGQHFGGRNHATVLNAWRQTAQRMAVDPDVRQAVEDIRTSLQTPHQTPA